MESEHPTFLLYAVCVSCGTSESYRMSLIQFSRISRTFARRRNYSIVEDLCPFKGRDDYSVGEAIGDLFEITDTAIHIAEPVHTDWSTVFKVLW